MKENDY